MYCAAIHKAANVVQNCPAFLNYKAGLRHSEGLNDMNKQRHQLKQRPAMVPLNGSVADVAEIIRVGSRSVEGTQEESPLDIMEGGPTSYNS